MRRTSAACPAVSHRRARGTNGGGLGQGSNPRLNGGDFFDEICSFSGGLFRHPSLSRIVRDTNDAFLCVLRGKDFSYEEYLFI